MMSCIKVGILLAILGALSCEAKSLARDGKQLGLFNIVTFKNRPCNADSGMNGTCYLNNECTGVASGKCAQGMGVCCVFTFGCGTSSSKNNSYFVNPGGSAGTTEKQDCSFTYNKPKDICALRLDFDTFDIAGPKADATALTTFTQCVDDKFTVTGGSHGASNTICGLNTGRHMYVPTKRAAGNIDLKMVVAASGRTNMWKIKVSEIACNSVLLPPSGCTEYHMGIRGKLQTYNWKSSGTTATGVHLANQLQTICVRKEEGFCEIEMKQEFGTAGDDVTSFGISTEDTLNGLNGVDCMTDSLTIANAGKREGSRKFADVFCGQKLTVITTANADTDKAAVYTLYKSAPFVATFQSDDQEHTLEATPAALPVNPGFKGFSIDYVQVPC